MTTALPQRRRPSGSTNESSPPPSHLKLFQHACMVMGSYRKAERWFEANHPLLNASPMGAVTTGKGTQLGALLEALSKGWAL